VAQVCAEFHVIRFFTALKYCLQLWFECCKIPAWVIDNEK